MGRRATRSHEAPVSFFGFQDLVCCATGTLTLVFLMLAVELIGRQSNGVPAMSAAESLRKQLEIYTNEKNQMEKDVAQGNKLLKDLSGGTVITQGQLDGLAKEVNNLDAVIKMTIDKKAKAEKEKTDLDRQVVLTLKKNEDLERTIKEFERTIKDKKDAPTVSWLVGTMDKKPLLVECASNTVTVAQIPDGGGAAQVVKRFADEAPYASFVNWAKENRNPGVEYFMLLVRPEAAQHFDTVSQGLLRSRFELGWDVWPEGRTLVKPQ